MVTPPSDKKKWIVSIEAQTWEFELHEDALTKAKALLDVGVWFLHAKKGI